MADDVPAASWAMSAGRRRNMQANKSKDTRPEVVLRSLLHERGLRFRKHHRPLPGIRLTVDIAFTRRRIAVFVDGCFWHGCSEHYHQPQRNADYWVPKIKRTIQRDELANRRLDDAGWLVIRAWEHEDPNDVVDRIERAARGRNGAGTDSSLP